LEIKLGKENKSIALWSYPGAKFCSFKLVLSAGIAGELSLIIKDEECPDDALLFHLPVKPLISYTWVASNPLFAFCTSGSKF